MIAQGRPVDQFFVAFDGPVRDVNIVAGSVPATDLPSAVAVLLRTHTRLHQSGSHQVPDWSLSYYRPPFDTAVVLRRSSVGHSPGRGNSHALHGTAADLTPDLALRLGAWRGWRDEAISGSLRKFGPGELSEGLVGADHDLRERARRSPWLGRVLALLLADPAADLSIVGCPDHERLPLLWGLYEIGRALPELHRRAWTFSTYEVGREETEHLPEIIFLPGDPVGGVSGDNRRQLDLGAPPGPECNGTADDLVAEYQQTGTVSARSSIGAGRGMQVSGHPADPTRPAAGARYADSGGSAAEPEQTRQARDPREFREARQSRAARDPWEVRDEAVAGVGSRRRRPRDEPAQAAGRRRLVTVAAGVAAVLVAVSFLAGFWVGDRTTGSDTGTDTGIGPTEPPAATSGSAEQRGVIELDTSGTWRRVTGTWSDPVPTQRLYLALKDRAGFWQPGAECLVLHRGLFTCDYQQPQQAGTTLVLLAVDAADDAGLKTITDQLVGTSAPPAGAREVAHAPTS